MSTGIDEKLMKLNNRNRKTESLKINNKDEMQDVAEYFSSFALGHLPPFDLTVSEEITPKCRLHSAEYQRQLQNLTFWAIKMYDSSAKIPSGILSGNLNQLGDFDECVNSHSDDGEISGQYCLTYFQIDEPNSKYLYKLHKLMNSHFPFRSTFDDPGHRVPRFSAINWALCVPSSCTHEDVEIGLKAGLQPLIDKTGLSIQIKVYEEMCQTVKRPIPLSTILGGIFFAIVIGFTLAITAIDYFFQNPSELNGIQGILFAFSLRRTVKSLFSLNRAEGDIASVHGIRFLNAFMLIVAHKSLAVFFIPYVNRTIMTEIIGKPWTVLGRAASLYTDPFIMFSGMLTTYSYFGRLNRGKSINIIDEYVSRLMRIVPPLVALILFCTLIQPWLGSGPQWNLVVTHHSDICKQYWWRNLLFIHNYFGFENMCLTHTHHVGIDTQLFLISPLFIWILWKWRRRGIMVLITLATISTIMRYNVTYSMGLSNYIHFGTSIKQLFNTANNMYILPTHRTTVYLMGVLLGYYLRNMKNVILKPAVLNIGHATAVALFCAAFFGPAFMGDISYKYQPVHAAWYAAFSPIAWCLSFAWIIFTQHFGYYNFLNKFFSWRGWIVTTRLSYALYLTQFPVFFYNVGSARSSDYYHFAKIMINIHELTCIVALSIILTLLFDTPFQTIRKIIFKKNDKKIVQKQELNIENENSQKTEIINNTHNDSTSLDKKSL
ncbi:O-acyltransferase like protein [Chrysoperla carnea]|uniref:O-acyltransferase like protein n=1 Tax=Chrysoperla carnea TaxID=189513 RepID=UPI001D08F2E2|nr:O-acyltransferase like protein [Chrysoperla carnea]